mmetsp:Transcript_50468/g.120936  ORF Transcript_50468/g.120936 Transcript_50468/m.120936 type:complete len:134 (-) Transcript_50468:130-531(-)
MKTVPLLLLSLLGFFLILSTSSASYIPPTQPMCAARSSAAMRLRGGGLGAWFTDGYGDMVEKEDDGTKEAEAEAGTEGAPAAVEEPKRKRCEQIARRAECKAQEECIYDTARGCYTKPSYLKEMAAKAAEGSA